MRRITNKEAALRARFQKLATEAVIEAGGAPNPRGSSYDYILPTSVGPLSIGVYDNWIATRFTSAKGGTAATGGCSNGYSGKWNFHAFERDWIQPLLDSFRHGLAMVLAYQPTPAVLRDVKLDLAEDRCRRVAWEMYVAEERAAERNAAGAA
jgi:hypothetical protein